MVSELELASTNVAETGALSVGAASTVRIKDWMASDPTPLCAVKVIGKVPLWVGVPQRVAMSTPLSVKLTPSGRVPDSVIETFGSPIDVTSKTEGDPTSNVPEGGEVKAGGYVV